MPDCVCVALQNLLNWVFVCEIDFWSCILAEKICRNDDYYSVCSTKHHFSDFTVFFSLGEVFIMLSYRLLSLLMLIMFFQASSWLNH